MNRAAGSRTTDPRRNASAMVDALVAASLVTSSSRSRDASAALGDAASSSARSLERPIPSTRRPPRPYSAADCGSVNSDPASINHGHAQPSSSASRTSGSAVTTRPDCRQKRRSRWTPGASDAYRGMPRNTWGSRRARSRTEPSSTYSRGSRAKPCTRYREKASGRRSENETSPFVMKNGVRTP